MFSDTYVRIAVLDSNPGERCALALGIFFFLLGEEMNGRGVLVDVVGYYGVAC